MVKQASNTFGAMRSALRSLGFIPVRHGQNIVFTHPNGRPVILLPAYKPGEVVKPIHQMMVRKQLADAGMLRSSNLTPRRGGFSAKIKSLKGIRFSALRPGKFTISGR